MSIVLSALEAKVFFHAVDDVGLAWVKLPQPKECNVQCWKCHEFMKGSYWYSLDEAVPYCVSCVTEPTIEPHIR